MKFETGFSQKPLGHFQPNFACKLLGTRKIKFMNMTLVRDVRKMDLSYANQEKVGQSYTFLETYHIPGSAEKKGDIPPTHPYYAIYI